MLKKFKSRSIRLLFAIIIFNIQGFCEVPTLGGIQFWNDISVSGNHKIQQNVITGHCRILKNDWLRLHWGSENYCREKFDTLRKPQNHAQVFLIHGLGRSHHSMATLAKKLRSQNFIVHNLEYSSMLSSPEKISARVANLINEHPNTQNYFITHSFGGIILRHAGQTSPVHKVALLAAPNQGSKICESLESIGLNFLLGPAGKELYRTSPLMSKLPPPPAPFITIAGNRKSGLKNWPLGFLFKENSDGIVCESRTHLKDSLAHHQVDASHTFIMNHPKVEEIILDFFAIPESN
jgi:pimeloyl-ACP methyl ester carboxylesterase